MNVGYYFHLPAAFSDDGSVSVPAWHGDIIEGLASQCGTITYFAHDAEKSAVEDRVIGPPLVRPINVGPKRSAPALSFNPRPTLRRIEPHLSGLDALLIRAPTPLLPHLVRHSPTLPTVVLVMADYANWRPTVAQPAWRNVLIAGWIAIYRRLEERSLRRVRVLVIGRAHRDKLAARGVDADLVFSSTLHEQDVLDPDGGTDRRWDGRMGRDRPVRLLYSGRLVEEKGIFDCLEAVAALQKRKWRVEFDFVGWWTDPRMERKTRELARSLGVNDSVRWTGYVPAGPRLMQHYRNADIYVHASRNEAAVSQTIKEAMASFVPVVTTHIPENDAELRDGENAILVAPGSATALADGIERLLTAPEVANRIAGSGWQWARTRTLERSCALIAEHVERCVTERQSA